MPFNCNYKCDHEKNRQKVCAPCGNKIKITGKNNIEYYSVNNNNYVSLIQKFINKNFTISDSKFPLGICNTCRNTIVEYNNNCFKRSLPSMPNYEDIYLSKETRTESNKICNCYICLRARFKGYFKVKKGKGNLRKTENKINLSTGIYEASTSVVKLKNRFIENENSTPEKKTLKLCKSCFQEVGRGIRHDCGKNNCSNVRNARKIRANLLKVLEKTSETMQEKVVSSVIKKKCSKSEFKKNNDCEILLANASRSDTKIILRPKNKPCVNFSIENLDRFKRNMGLSTNHMKKMANFLRSATGKKSVPKNFREHLFEKSNLLSNIYKEDIRKFHIDKTDIKEEKNKKKSR